MIFPDSIIIPGVVRLKRGTRPRFGETALTNTEHHRRYRQQRTQRKLKNIAVLDFETDPFRETDHAEIHPFCCELYSDQFAPIVLWDEDYETLIEKLLIQLEMLDEPYTIYAHNGGKFDFMFFIHKIRGSVKFKGRAIMSARVGKHEIRDSLHLLPERLASWKKDHFDYSKMHKKNRNKFREEILAYQHSDCVYLFDFISRFVKEFGLKISIGAAAFTRLKAFYKIAPIKQRMDHAIREYFLGGRVECIAGQGLFESSRQQSKPYKLFDVNSMYPYVMAHYQHPTGAEYLWHRGQPNENTFFIDLNCKSYGAMFQRLEHGELDSGDCEGRFMTTIWEYKAALKYGLIENVKINWCIDNVVHNDFRNFIVPMYSRRQETKVIMDRLKKAGQETCPEFEETKKENIFLKYLLNNSYGKTAQNPEKYKEYFYTDHGEMPPKEWMQFLEGASDEIRHEYSMPVERSDSFDVWVRPSPGTRYNNVGTGASITGAARSILLEAIQNSLDPIYCDTDSLICRDLKAPLSETELGAWKIEETFDSVIIGGKKTYACMVAGKSDGQESRLKVRSKGVDLRVRPARDGFEIPDPSPGEWKTANAATWQRYLDLLDDKVVTVQNRAPTFNKLGQQHYMTRRIRATAPLVANRSKNAARIVQIGSR